MTNTPAPGHNNPPQENLALRVEQFVKLRDMKKIISDRHKDELEPINNAMEQLQTLMGQAMRAQNVESVATAAGTAHFTTRSVASAADFEALWTWCIVNGSFDMLDRKPNATAIKEYVAQHGVAPPGVNYSEIVAVGVRRK